MLLIQNGKPIPPSETMRRVTAGYFTANGIKKDGLLFTGITSSNPLLLLPAEELNLIMKVKNWFLSLRIVPHSLNSVTPEIL